MSALPPRAFGLVLAGLLACGPTVSPSGSDGSGSMGSEGTGAATAESQTNTSSPDPTGSATTTGADSGTQSTGMVGTIPMYGTCDLQAPACQPDLLCAVVGLREGVATSICTAQCLDPAADCEPAPEGWAPVCNGFFHDMPPDPFCAIGCGADQACPEGMICGTEVPFTPPYYCIPT